MQDAEGSWIDVRAVLSSSRLSVQRLVADVRVLVSLGRKDFRLRHSSPFLPFRFFLSVDLPV